MKGLGLSLAKPNYISATTAAGDYWVGDGVNDYISGIGENPFMWTDLANQDLSISFWVRIDSTTKKNQQFFSLSDSTSSTNNCIIVNYSSSVNRIIYRQRWAGNNHDIQIPLHNNSSTTGITDSATGWTASSRGNTNSDGFVNITVTHDASAGTSGMKVYWNGTEISDSAVTNSYTGTKTNWYPSQLGLGDHIGNTNPSAGALGGALDEVKIYGDVLTSSEVTTIYNSGTPASANTTHSADLITEWSLRGVVTDSNNNFVSTNNGGTYESY